MAGIPTFQVLFRVSITRSAELTSSKILDDIMMTCSKLIFPDGDRVDTISRFVDRGRAQRQTLSLRSGEECITACCHVLFRFLMNWA